MKKFDTEVRLSREMSLMDATLIGVGAMIGAGIFVLIGIAAGVAGPAIIVTFVLNGIVALLTAMSYAELGSCYHDAGGGYLWVKEGLPKWNGFISGWMGWFAHAVACSLYALGFGAYFELVFKEFAINVPQWGFISPQKLLAAVAAIVFGYVNFRGASEAGKIGNLVTITKIVILAIFIGFGIELMLRKPDILSTFNPFMPNGWGGVFKAMGLTFIAFQGFEVIAQSSEEIKNPKKNIPKAVFLSLAIVIPIYLLVAVTAIGSVHPGNMTPWAYLAEKKEIALVDVARNFFNGGGIMLLFGGLISTMSALNATIFSSSRVAFAMGRDRNFPTFFSKVHKKNFTPHWGILISLFLIVLMAISLPIEDVASAADIMFLLLFLQVNLAMIKLRKKRPDLDRGFFVPLYPYLSIVGIAMLLFIAIYMFNYSLIAWIVTIIWIALGLLVFKFYASGREVEYIRKVNALERIERKEYTILVCLSNEKTMPGMVSIAIAIAKKNSGRILLLNVVEVEEGKKLMAGMDATELVKPILDKAESIVNAAGLPVRTLVKVSHRVSQGIIDTAIEEGCNFIVSGRQKQPTFFDRMFSSLIDTVIQKAPTEVAVLHGDFIPENVRNILIPYSPDAHTMLATEIAPYLSELFHAKLHIAIVLDPALPKSEREEKINKVKQSMQEFSLEANIEPVYDTDILRGLLRRSKHADLMLMGGRTGDFLELLLAKSLAQEITEQVKCPVIWAKEYEERPSFWLSLLKPYKLEGAKNG